MKTKILKMYNEIDWNKFIQNDPVQVPRRMSQTPGATTADIEICAIWTAIMCWGKSSLTVSSATKLMDRCGWRPLEYILSGEYHSIGDNEAVFRNIDGKSFKNICWSLENIYRYGDIQSCIKKQQENGYDMDDLITDLANILKDSKIGFPGRYSSCKRLCILLRWMVRKDNIDLGLWNIGNISPANLYAIVDAQKIKIMASHFPHIPRTEKWSTVEEITLCYAEMIPEDPLICDVVLQYQMI